MRQRALRLLAHRVKRRRLDAEGEVARFETNRFFKSGRGFLGAIDFYQAVGQSHAQPRILRSEGTASRTSPMASGIRPRCSNNDEARAVEIGILRLALEEPLRLALRVVVAAGVAVKLHQIASQPNVVRRELDQLLANFDALGATMLERVIARQAVARRKRGGIILECLFPFFHRLLARGLGTFLLALHRERVAPGRQPFRIRGVLAMNLAMPSSAFL